MESISFLCPYHKDCTWATWTERGRHQISWSCGARGPIFEHREAVYRTIPTAAENRGKMEGVEDCLVVIGTLFPEEERWRYFGSPEIRRIEKELQRMLRDLHDEEKEN